MLYDPKWEQQTKANPRTMKHFIAWLEKQPADKEYDWHCPTACLVCQYQESIGISRRMEGRPSLDETLGPNKGWYWRVAGTKPFTFGAALERARADLTF